MITDLFKSHLFSSRQGSEVFFRVYKIMNEQKTVCHSHQRGKHCCLTKYQIAMTRGKQILAVSWRDFSLWLFLHVDVRPDHRL